MDAGTKTRYGNFKLGKINARSIEIVINVQLSHGSLEHFELYLNQFFFIGVENRNFQRIVSQIRITQRLRCVEHMFRIKEERPPRQVLRGGMAGKRGKSGSQTTWMQTLLQDFELMRNSNWERLMGNNQKW